jgi:protein-disulfide isomerase-like protein with CxxC motif
MSETKLKVLVFTDPYCSWCWATEPMLITMQERYRDQIHFHYVFGGLVKDIAEFYDASNNIGSWADCMPHWKMVSERSGQPINEKLCIDLDKVPHQSTWPANIAAKAAFLQSEDIGARYLRRIRIAVESERKIISFPEVYEPLAKEIQRLDFDRFQNDIKDGKAKEAFEKDLRTCAIWEAYGFPTMLFYRSEADLDHLTRENAAYVGGHRSMETYDRVIRTLVPDIKVYQSRSEEELLAVYGPMTDQELAQVYNRTKEEEIIVLTQLENNGTIFCSPRVRGNLWSLEKIKGDYVS